MISWAPHHSFSCWYLNTYLLEMRIKNTENLWLGWKVSGRNRSWQKNCFNNAYFASFRLQVLHIRINSDPKCKVHPRELPVIDGQKFTRDSKSWWVIPVSGQNFCRYSTSKRKWIKTWTMGATYAIIFRRRKSNRPVCCSASRSGSVKPRCVDDIQPRNSSMAAGTLYFMCTIFTPLLKPRRKPSSLKASKFHHDLQT